ncbi:unnamed protein product [Cuscuta epithymum]|uniref:Uncharacterized protein n=1 Tax=Cuscuta epithymum TaxID=186058 RepID=A0AAV0GAA5_9ASTE|nr:unnamed protein product [Cuscuta epithymum]
MLRCRRARRDDARRRLHPRLHGGDPLHPPALVLSPERRLPLRRLRLRGRVAATRHDRVLVPVSQVSGVPVRRFLRRGADLHLHPLRAGLSAELRPQLLGQHFAALRQEGRLPGLRFGPRRRHCQARRHASRRKPSPRRAGVLQREFHILFHADVLVKPLPLPHLRESERLLLQHGGYGDRSRSVENRGLYDEDRGMDGVTEANQDLRAGLATAVSVSLRRENSSGRSPVEPARAGGRQLPGALPRFASRTGESSPLEWEREAVGPAGR